MGWKLCRESAGFARSQAWNRRPCVVAIVFAWAPSPGKIENLQTDQPQSLIQFCPYFSHGLGTCLLESLAHLSECHSHHFLFASGWWNQMGLVPRESSPEAPWRQRSGWVLFIGLLWLQPLFVVTIPWFMLVFHRECTANNGPWVKTWVPWMLFFRRRFHGLRWSHCAHLRWSKQEGRSRKEKCPFHATLLGRYWGSHSRICTGYTRKSKFSMCGAPRRRSVTGPSWRVTSCEERVSRNSGNCRCCHTAWLLRVAPKQSFPWLPWQPRTFAGADRNWAKKGCGMAGMVRYAWCLEW